jgi:hypothetical protein
VFASDFGGESISQALNCEIKEIQPLRIMTRRGVGGVFIMQIYVFPRIS